MQLYLILGVAWVLSVAGATWYGYDWGDESATNKARAAHATALEKSVADARQTAIEDMQLEAEKQKERTITKIEYRDRLVKIQESINANPLPDNCVIPEPRRMLLNDAINAANSKIIAKP